MWNRVKNSKTSKLGQTRLKSVKFGKLESNLPSLTKLTKIINSSSHILWFSNLNLSNSRLTPTTPEIASSSAKSLSAASSPSRPAGLRRAAPLLKPAPRITPQLRANGTVSHMQPQQIENPTNGESEEFDETRGKLQMIRVKFLLLAHRLWQTPYNVVVA